MDEVRQHLTTLLTDKFEVPRDQITDTTPLADLDLDSLARVELVVTLQEHWKIPLEEDDDTLAGQTVRQLVVRVHELLGSGVHAAESS